MVVRSFVCSLRRSSGGKLKVEGTILSRFISSPTFSSIGDATAANTTVEPSTKSSITKIRVLEKEILKLNKFPGRSPTTVLQNWVNKGYEITVPQLRYICRRLVKFRHYKQALEILTWKKNQRGFRMSATDHAERLELILKVHGLREAEKYFECITDSASQKAAFSGLLHGYVKGRETEKAEALMMKMNELGLVVTPHPFNEMMKLYMATSQYDKVPLVILQMKRNKIHRNVLSYNVWMSACSEVSGISKAEMVYKEMLKDKNVEVGWTTLCTLANIYVQAGLVESAVLALEKAERKLSTTNRRGYLFLITIYASLNNRDGVHRLWQASKVVGARMTCADYMCILSSLVKVGDFVEAEKVYLEWESNCQKYDIRVSNVLLGAYMRNRMMDKAELLHLHTLDRGGCPNYKTWEILMEGWVKSQEMDKAINAMREGFARLKDCHWRPSHDILMAIAVYFEKCGNIEGANQYIRFIHCLGLASLSFYKILLRMHLNAQRPALDILKMMEKDNIGMDDETSALVESFDG